MFVQKRNCLTVFVSVLLGLFLESPAMAGNIGHEPDSVYLLSYATTRNNNHNGLQFAWSRDRANWEPVGNDNYGFLKCDYGRWGAEKRMLTPFLLQGPGGKWECVWSVNEHDLAFAHAASTDLLYWGRQSYPMVKQGKNVLRPVVQYDNKRKWYTVTYTDDAGKYYQVVTNDFKTYGPAIEVGALLYDNSSLQTTVLGEPVSGQVHRVAWQVVQRLLTDYDARQYSDQRQYETTKQDPVRFAGLQSPGVTITVEAAKAKPISDLLTGVFFEDINYAADGGLYAELVQNRDFEYTPQDRGNWNSTYAWHMEGEHTTLSIDTTAAIHPHNTHYAVLETTTPGAALVNDGFDGIVVRKGARYDFSLFVKQVAEKTTRLQVSLVDKSGSIVAKGILKSTGKGWKKKTLVLTATADATVQLHLAPLSKGTIALDMVSLFPQNTFKGEANGLRADLAQAIADIHPRFIRFPGGCVAHGDGLANIYRWKNTIGPLEARVPQRNMWGYHQSAGLGYFEYFRFCEDIGAEPVPVVAAGVPCQNSGTGGAGQQGGIPMDQMDEYVQDILDLVEYANGDIHTKWGKMRAEAGHPEPFHLKYIGVGNEDLITDVFEQRFALIYNALKLEHPEITVIGTVGPFWEGTDYVEGWKIATRYQVPIVDEHYYQPPGWFIYHQDFYDQYDRTHSKVYLGEYAAHLPGRPNNLETALAEALYLTAVERNGDVVSMASYAPLLAKEGHTQWSPDLIYFNNSEVKTTVGYEVQKLYGNNAGNEYLPVDIHLSDNREEVRKRVAISVVRDTQSGDLIVKLVNLLPVAVNAGISIPGVDLTGKQAVQTVLKGNPADKHLKPLVFCVNATDAFKAPLPPYSFTVIRVGKISK